ncbi:hypothetical protein MMC07_001781 [Pseudocyphellaria aurata]|nr:hypothetical protein [Pseudocyphellaria aurata]
MKQMQRDPLSRQKALRAERRADEKSGVQVITIKPLGAGGSGSNKLTGGDGNGGGSGGFKKGGFKNAFGEPDGSDEKKTVRLGAGEGMDIGDGDEAEIRVKGREGETKPKGAEEESESEDEGEEKYDPRRPTGCRVGCRGR